MFESAFESKYIRRADVGSAKSFAPNVFKGYTLYYGREFDL